MKRSKRTISIMMIVCMLLTMIYGTGVVQAADGEPVDAYDFMSSHSIKINGVEYQEGQLLDPSESFATELAFSYNWDDISTNGKSYSYTLPEHISIGDVASQAAPNTLYNAAQKDIGTYYYKDNVIYFTFHENTGDQTAFFNLEASWEGVENMGDIVIPWNDGDQVIEFDSAHIIAVKDQESSFTLRDDGRFVKKYTVTIQPKDEYSGRAISNISLYDTFSGGGIYFADNLNSNTTQDISIKLYNDLGELAGTQWKDFSSANVTVNGNNKTFEIGGINIPAGGKAVVEYYVEIPAEERIEFDSKNSAVHHINTAIASHKITNTSTGETETLKSSSKVEQWYSGGNSWIFKEAGSAETIVDENEVELNSIPYTISINRYRSYSLGGSIVNDTIAQFLGDSVVYDTATKPYVEKAKGWGNEEEGAETEIITLNWVVIPYITYGEFEGLTMTSSKTAMERLLSEDTFADLRTKLLSAINSALGTKYTALTDDILGSCVFTYNTNESGIPSDAKPNFIWLMPLDKDGVPSSYFFHYNVLATTDVGSISNYADMWYTEYEAGHNGGGRGWRDPKALSVSKGNEGVYQGPDGNFYVDWTIGITLPANSGGFEQIALWDWLQKYENVPIGDNGNTYTVTDWLAGVSDGDFSFNYFYEDCGDNSNSEKWRQYIRDFSEKIFTVSSSSEDPAVQAVVERVEGGFFWSAWNFGWPTEYNNSKYALDCSPAGFKNGGLTYSGSGDAAGAGQFTVDYTFDSYGIVNNGDTISPATMIFYIGDLPATKTGYTINIEYTTQVNPELVEALPEILERDGLNEIELTNEVVAHQAIPSDNSFRTFYLAPSAGRIAQADSSYWLSTSDFEPPISKSVEYNNTSDTLDYTVEVNPDKTLVADNTTYRLRDELSIEGIKYVANSIVVYDESGAIIYSTDSSKTAAAKYKNYVKFSATTSGTALNSFVLDLDNSTGLYGNASGKLQNITIEYSVDATAIPDRTKLQNIVKLFNLVSDGTSGTPEEVLLGTASTEQGPESALDKVMREQPTGENNYTATFAVLANLESKYADDYLKGLEVGDVFTINDTFEKNLSLDIDSIGVYYFNESTEKYVKMTSGYVLKYDDYEKVLSADITVRSGASKYMLQYEASVIGEQDKYANIVNTAEIEGSSVSKITYEDMIYKYSYGAGAITEERVITLVKYDEINLETRLQGAQFELYKLTDGSWVELTTPENDVPSLTTSVDGKVVISNSLSEVSQFVQDDCWYKLVEVKSPAGYALDETPIYYYVTDKEGNEPSVIPDGVVDYKIIDSAEGLVMVANDGLAIKIYKEDKIDGTALTGAAFSVYSNSACTNLLASSEAVSGENGAYLVDHIPVSSANATLYLKETKAPTGYSLDTTVYKITFENSQVKSIVSVDGTKTLNFSVEANGIELDYTNDATTGKLTISKEVIAKSDAAAAKSFTFTVNLTNASGTTLTANYAYTKFDADGKVAGTGTIKSGNTCTLTDGQSIMIKGLPAGAKYTVTETVNAEFDPYYNIKNYAGTYDFTESKQGNVATGTIVAGDMDTVEFENRQYEEITVSALKILDAGTLEEQGEFEFELYDPAGQLVDTAVVDNQFGTAKFETPLKFYNTGTYNYKIKEKVPTDKPDYITYSTETITAKIVVTLDSSGNLKAAVTYSGGTGTSNNAITNKYSATGSITFTADKLINGQSDSEFMTAGAFEFEIREGSTLVATGKNDASGNIVFSEIEYELNGTTDNTGRHTYTVSEKSKTVKGWTYDDDTYTVVVDVTDNYDGTLNVSVVSGATKSGNNYAITPKSGKDAAFENTYEASASLNFRADKVLNGRTLAANQFEFAIYEGTTLIDTAKNTANGTITFDAIEFYRSYDGTDEETYLGTHTYTIKEVIPSPKVGGYTYDGTTYTVKVTATDDGKGNITLAVTGATKSGSTSTYDVNVSAGKVAAFVNSYSAEGSITFVADKLVNNDADHEFMTAGAFEFEIRQGSTVVATGKNDANGNVTFTAIKYERNSTTDDVKNHTYTVVEKSGTLKGWTYDDDSYTVVVAVTDNNNGTLTAKATSGATASGSNYKITPKSGKTAVFENEYEVSEELVLMADKILEGRTLAANQFEFAVYEGTTVVATGKNTADGTIKFTPIEFYRTYDGTTEETYLGTHTYTIKEVIPSPKVGGYTYDETVYTVKVTATDNGKGDISFTVTGASATSTTNTYEVTPTSGKNAVFVNEYAAEGSIIFTADKYINGMAGFAFMKAGAFQFQILDENDDVVAEGETDDDGNIVFSAIEYVRNSTTDDVGTHTYTVVEKSGTLKGWTYDDSEYTVVVKVTDNNNGTLTAVATSGATADGDNFAITPATGNEAVFENKYEVSEELVFNASKILLGRVIEDEQFQFAIYEGDEVVATGKNDIDGNIKFTPIEFYRLYETTEETYLGEHTYTIKEVIPSPKVGGYTYDEIVYTVTVVATDDGKGDISFVVTGATLDGEANNYVIDVPADQEATFINYYEAEGSITFEGIKDLTGRTQDEGEFSFIITEYKIVDGERVATGKVFNGTNTADGEIIFDEIKYVQNKDINETGSYVYEVVEFIPADEDKRGGVTYDDVTKYEVETVVVDNGDGTLGITPSDNYVELDFFNEYDAVGYIDISATKHILTSYDTDYDDMSTDGVDMENVFEFSIYEYVDTYDEEGNYLSTEEVLLETIYVKPGETIDFTTIEYHIWDVREHVYKIVENRTGNAGYGFDTYEYIFVVSLADNRDGTLAVAITDEYGEPVGTVDINQANCSVEFTNKYNATGSTYLTGTKDILNADQMLENGELVDDEFSFTVYEGTEPFTEETLVAEDMIVATGLSKADGTIEFTEMWYDISMLGTHYYAIYEDSEVGVNNVLNTAKFVNVMVEVKNNGDGTLDVIVEYSRDGEVLETAQFTNEATEVEITKKDAKGQVLPGAELEILDAEGNVVFEFVSTEESQKVYGLAVETVYTLHEAKAPDGYELADDINFMVDAEGNTVIIESETKQSEVTSIIMVDELIPEAPATGDESHVSVMMLLTVLSLATSVLVYMKKKEEEK